MSVSAETGALRTGARPFASAVLSRDVPLVVLVAAFAAEPSTRDFALVNLLVQALLFTFGACLPAYRRRVMAFTDCVWPWGLAAIGVQALVFATAASPLVVILAAIYVVMGVRGGTWAVSVAITDFPHDDLPRYRYRRLVWQHEGYRSETLPMLHEIAQQGLSNASLLAAPAMLVVADRHGGVGPVVIAGAVVWAVSWALESVADLQKGRFARLGTPGTCEVGLWRFSRHPNYFFQWLQWWGIVLVALPSLVRLAGDIALLPWLGLAAALLSIPGGMYYVLVHFTGAIPAEHFSSRHRSGYREYQQRVNRFAPGPPTDAAVGSGQ